MSEEVVRGRKKLRSKEVLTIEVFCPLCEETFESDNIEMTKHDYDFYEEHGYVVEACDQCKEIKSKCCFAEIITVSYKDYPISDNPFSKNYVVQVLEKDICEKCGQEV